MEQLTDLGSVLRIAKRRALYFIVPAVVISAVGSAIVMFLPAIYRSQATILVESQQIPSELVQSTVTAMADERLQVHWAGGGRSFAEGERIHTEISCKYTPDNLAALLQRAGFRKPQAWYDAQRWFAVVWAEA